MNSANAVVALAIAKAITATDTGAAVDVHDLDGLGVITLTSSAGGGTTPTSNVKIQHSDDGLTGWIDSGKAFAQVTTTAGMQALLVNTKDFKKFIRAVNTLGGTSPAFSYSVTLVGVTNKESFFFDVTPTPPVPGVTFFTTQAGDFLVTQAGNFLILQG